MQDMPGFIGERIGNQVMLAVPGNHYTSARDKGRVLTCSATLTVTLHSEASAGNGFPLSICNTGSGSVTVNKKDGTLFLTLAAGDLAMLDCNGTSWVAIMRYVSLGASSGFDPETQAILYEDLQGAVIPAATSDIQGAFYWLDSGGPSVVTMVAGRNGVVSVGDDATGIFGHLLKNDLTQLNWAASKNPVIHAHWAPYGTAASIFRRLGLTSAAFTAGNPANGIFFRTTNNGGNIIAVCRSGGTESTLDTGIASADGVFHACRMTVTGTTSVAVHVDGVAKGTITTNIPSASLAAGWGGNNGPATGASGIYVDSFFIAQDR